MSSPGGLATCPIALESFDVPDTLQENLKLRSTGAGVTGRRESWVSVIHRGRAPATPLDAMRSVSSQPAEAPANKVEYDWPLCYEAEKLVSRFVEAFFERNTFASSLARRMRDETGTDFFEWIDHLVVADVHRHDFEGTGYRVEDVEAPAGITVLHHPKAMLPRVLVGSGFPDAHPVELAIRPEHVADFVAAHALGSPIEGEPLAPYRRALVSDESGAALVAVERMAHRGFVVDANPLGRAEAVLKAREILHTRKRRSASDEKSMQLAFAAVGEALALVGRDVTCHFFFEAERAYWQSRNRAARMQHFRQERLGLGWGNHDHHTFRCSRHHFVDLIELLVSLGFEKRERYYAGAEAGWGAQILEQPVAGIVVFADVDLMPEETSIDFSAHRLPPSKTLRTVGLWTGLHGDSLLDAGMHHLEARFDFDRLRDQLQGEGISTMKPFSDFEFLRQAFTEGERWPVSPIRAHRLRDTGLITPEQHDAFLRDGAIGSHLENLQRRGGFKGFNQKSVSVIISATDPRGVQEQAHAGVH